MTSRLIYLIAGEASGDLLGADLMRALKVRQPSIQFAGVGGQQMMAEGLEPLFPMQELSVMGFLEILPHIPKLAKRLRQTVKRIESLRPDMLVTIDSPGFTLRVAKRLKAHGSAIPRFHYVAPSVWAYKPQRAGELTKLVDHLFCLFPFEPPYFTKEGLDATFIGHPIAQAWKEKPDGQVFRHIQGIPESAILVGLMPGSRRGELRRLLPIFSETIKRLSKKLDNIHIMLPVVSHLKDETVALLRSLSLPIHVVDQPDLKKAAFAACDLALSKSGTVSLELAAAGVPTITAHRVNTLSAWLLRRMVRTKFVNLVNIVLGREVVQEYLQERCRPDLLAPALLQLHRDESAKSAQRQAFADCLRQLGREDAEFPGEKAAAIISQRLKLS